MKICPDCSLNYSDEFSFCEFDGTTLQEIQPTKTELRFPTHTILPYLKNLQYIGTLTRLSFNRNQKFLIAGTSALILSALIGYYYATKPKSQLQGKATIRSKSINQTPIFIDTPKAALDFVEAEVETGTQRNQQANPQSASKKDSENDMPEKPGVKVFTPQNNAEGNEGNTVSVRALPTSRQPKVANTQPLPDQASVKARDSLNSIQTQTTSKSTITPEPPRPFDTSKVAYRGVSLELLKVLPKRSLQGLAYEITLSVQNSGGRLIQWESLTMATNGRSSQSNTSTSRFLNRLGSPGRITFTLTSPEILTTTYKTTIRCSLFGRTIDNSAVAITIIIPLQT